VKSAVIVGGGAAGLCAAIALTKPGVAVEVAEIDEEIRPLGSGLTMNVASLRALLQIDEPTLELMRPKRAGVTTPLQTFMMRRFERCWLVVDNLLQLGEWEKDADARGADPVGLTDAPQSAMAGPF
jgi:glycine/D-amino acid oxidase-like deaminating enzyme